MNIPTFEIDGNTVRECAYVGERRERNGAREVLSGWMPIGARECVCYLYIPEGSRGDGRHVIAMLDRIGMPPGAAARREILTTLPPPVLH